MSLAIRRRGTLLSFAALSSALVLGAAGRAPAQPVIPVAAGQVQVQFDRVPADPNSGGLRVSLVEIGSLTSSPGRVLGDGSVCPQGARLSSNGLRIVCHSDASLLDWYKRVQSGATERKSGSVILVDHDSRDVLRTYRLHDCSPVAVRRHDPEDCDDSNPELIEVDLSVGAIEIAGRQRQDTGRGKFALDLNSCVAGGECPGTSHNEVTGLEISLDATCAAPGGQSDPWSFARACVVRTWGDDDCDGLWSMVLRCQAEPVPPTDATAVINTSRSNIKNQRVAGPPPTPLELKGIQIRSVTFPTFQVVPDAPPSPLNAIEKIEIAVEKVERG